MKQILLFTFIALISSSAQLQARVVIDKLQLITSSEIESINVFRPSRISNQKQLPLILNLHGYTNTPRGQHIVMPFKSLVDKKKFILINPAGIRDDKGNTYWTAENCCGTVKNPNDRRDDVAYLNSIIDALLVKYPIAIDKIFIAGHSNGGFMANKLACHPNSRISGIINYAGAGYSRPENCKVPKPIKVLHIHGNLDTVIRYDNSSDWHPSALASSLQWVKRNKCDLNFVAGNLASRPRSNKRITTQEWNNCEDKSKVSLWTILSGSHTELMSKKLISDIIDYLL